MPVSIKHFPVPAVSPRNQLQADFGQLGLALEEAPEAALPARLHGLGLPPGTAVSLTRNRSVLVSLAPRTGLRLHAGYAWAPDDVLKAIVIFLTPRVKRADRLAARRRFLSFPVERHVPSRRPRKASAPPDEHAPLIARLERMHQILNARHFGGTLDSIPIRLSDRMQSRLGEFRADQSRKSVEITVSRRHIRRDGWAAATDTLLHEMVHQWQCETGRPVDHGREFRERARAVGIIAAATVPASRLARISMNCLFD